MEKQMLSGWSGQLVRNAKLANFNVTSMSPVKRKYLKLAAGYVEFNMPRPVLIISEFDWQSRTDMKCQLYIITKYQLAFEHDILC